MKQIIYETSYEGMPIQVVDTVRSRYLRFDKEDGYNGKNVQTKLNKKEPYWLMSVYQKMVDHVDFEKANTYLILGLGGGTMPKYISHKNPEAKIDVVELLPEVIDIAYEYFALKKTPNITVYNEDGLEFIKNTEKTYDVIWWDIFGRGGKTPPHLKQELVQDKLDAILNDKGTLIFNKGSGQFTHYVKP